MTIEGDIKSILLKIPTTLNIAERNLYIKQSIDSFHNVYLYLESRNDYSERDLLEGRENLFNSFAQGYWEAGLVAGEAFLGFAGRLYALWIAKTIQFQEANSKRIHKGMAYNQLGWINSNYYKNNAKAYDYYLYAFIEDTISGISPFLSPAFIALTTTLFELRKEKALRIQEEISKTDISKMLPEDVVNNINKSIAVPTYEEVSETASDGLKSLESRWKNLKEEHKKVLNINTSIGTAFEEFAEDFFTKIRGFYSRGSGKMSYAMATGKKEHDYDLIIHNRTILFPELGNYLIVECKFRADKIGYEDLSKLFHKLHTKRCSTGILFTMEGVKDGNKNTTLREIYDNDGISIFIFDKTDIESIIEGRENLATLIRIKYEQVRFRLN